MKDNIFSPSGVYVAMVTPIDERGSLIREELQRITEWLISKGVNGLFPLGSTGEYIHYDLKQKLDILDLVLKQTGNRVPVVPGATESCSENCVTLIKEINLKGCQAAVVSPPYYFPSSQEMIVAHYEDTCAGVGDFPLILYNIPYYSTPIEYDSFKRLATIKNVVGIKDSSGSMVDLQNFIDIGEIINADLAVFTGREEMVYPALAVGASGCMTATAGLIPELVIELYQSFNLGDFNKARNLQKSMLELIRTMLMAPFPLGFKIGLECRGFKVGQLKKSISASDKVKHEQLRIRIEDLLKKLLGENMIVRL